MSTVKPSITVSDVTCINRVGTGPVYRAVVAIQELHGLLENSTIRYSPRYQRGFKKQPGDIPQSKYNLLQHVQSQGGRVPLKYDRGEVEKTDDELDTRIGC